MQTPTLLDQLQALVQQGAQPAERPTSALDLFNLLAAPQPEQQAAFASPAVSTPQRAPVAPRAPVYEGRAQRAPQAFPTAQLAETAPAYLGADPEALAQQQRLMRQAQEEDEASRRRMSAEMQAAAQELIRRGRTPGGWLSPEGGPLRHPLAPAPYRPPGWK